MTQSSREHKERFIRRFNGATYSAEREAVMSMFKRYGISILSDDLLDEATSDLVAAKRRQSKQWFRDSRMMRRELR